MTQFDWAAGAESGHMWTARFVISAAGCLTVPLEPDINGPDTFGGVLRLGAFAIDLVPHCPSGYNLMPYLGGLLSYRAKCAEVATTGYEGFLLGW
ncbi:MAG TPA: hypothetical protein VNF50_10265 [Acidimicrobiales bacterium]|nr:hypothetical protein [Acidimicrobiales bacterium]